jgi:hypothetical protein
VVLEPAAGAVAVSEPVAPALEARQAWQAWEERRLAGAVAPAEHLSARAARAGPRSVVAVAAVADLQPVVAAVSVADRLRQSEAREEPPPAAVAGRAAVWAEPDRAEPVDAVAPAEPRPVARVEPRPVARAEPRPVARVAHSPEVLDNLAGLSTPARTADAVPGEPATPTEPRARSALGSAGACA